MKKQHSWLAMIPAFILIGGIIAYPIGYTVYVSFTNMNIFNWFTFRLIGFRNYLLVLSVLDGGFARAFLITIVWTAINMVLQLVIAFLLAQLLNHPWLKGRGLYKTLLLIPWAMPGYVSILLWRTGMFNTQFGLLNQVLSTWGLSTFNWLASEGLAFSMMLIVNLWLALPFMIMIMDGALQSIDEAYYEAMRLESESFFSRIRMITVPLIRPAIAPAVIITMFTTFKQFDLFYLMILQPGARSGAQLHTVITYAYENAFITNNYGYSAAISVIIFILLIASVLLFQVKNAEVSDGR